MCTEYAAELILEQPKLAESVPYEFTVSGTQIVVKYKEKSHFISVSDNTCSCSFMKTLLMLAARTNAGTATFEPFLVAERWLKQYQLHIGVKPTTDGDRIEVEDDSLAIPSSTKLWY